MGKALEAIHEDVLGETSVLKSTRARRNRAAVVPPGLTITDETLKKLRSFKQFDADVENNSPSFQNLWDKVSKPPPNIQEIQKIKVIK